MRRPVPSLPTGRRFSVFHLSPVICMAFGAIACVPALKDAPPLVDLAGGGRAPLRVEVDGLLREAAAAFALRQMEAVRTAARTFLRAAIGDSTRVEGTIGAVRANIWLTDHEPDPKAREAAATAAVQAAQWCEIAAPDYPACAYWMGAALGVQARARPATGTSALPRIEASFKRAAEWKPDLEDGGPDRALALLYLRAPGWPAGPGDPERGLAHARKAVSVVADYPPNLMALAEALEANGSRAAARDTWSRALERARERQAAGIPDAADWVAESETAIGALDGR